MAWTLESVAADGTHLSYPVDTFPFRIGRDASNNLAVPAQGLSRQHAELRDDAGPGKLRLVDLGSTNGTYVDRERIKESATIDGSQVLHFGNAEFRLVASAVPAGTAPVDERTVLVPSVAQREKQFIALLGGEGLAVAAQPIVDARDGHVRAYELLGRCNHPGLPASPIQLFSLAASLGREAELSEAFRQLGVTALAPRLSGESLFVNAHPKETFDERFLRSLRALHQAAPHVGLIVEVHEEALTDVARMRELAAKLSELGVRFAYDDFGAGQARLNELGEVPAHCVKFDMGLIRNIDHAGERKRRVVGDLVKLVRDLGSIPLAEGVETEAEAAVCRELGFELIQGYLTGKPQPVPLPAAR